MSDINRPLIHTFATSRCRFNNGNLREYATRRFESLNENSSWSLHLGIWKLLPVQFLLKLVDKVGAASDSYGVAHFVSTSYHW